MIVKTKDPMKGWSDPVKLNFEGIDPDIFFDDNGKAYVTHNDAPEKPLYEGHRVIKVWEYDLEKDQIIPGTDKVVVNGGVDLSKKPIWIEAPHLYKKDGKYYLMCAEGGTGGWHSEVIFISDNPQGPFKPAPENPILSQRHLPAERPFKVDWAGHADLVEGPDGQYYGVFLAIRPNEANRVNTGRETFILPVDWSGTFPVFKGGLEPIQPKLAMPQGVKNETGKNGYFPNGNFTFTETFTGNSLDYRWVGVRGAREGFISTTAEGLTITPYETNIKAVLPTSTLFYRQQHLNFTATTTLKYVPRTEKDLAGITCYQSEKFNYVFGVTKKAEDSYIVLQRTEKGESSTIACEKIEGNTPISLRVTAEAFTAGFSYTGWPSRVISPLSGRYMPVKCRMMVDFPAPLGPTRPYTAPWGTVMLTPSRARKPSKVFTTFFASSIAVPSFPKVRPFLPGHAQVPQLLHQGPHPGGDLCPPLPVLFPDLADEGAPA